MSDFDFEPIRGLPQSLPAGERILWQGAPDWRALATGALHLRKLCVYFGVLVAWRAGASLADGVAPAEMLVSLLWLLPLVIAGIGLVALIAWLMARTTVYTITDRRIVMRIGVALPITFNIPFAQVDAAALRETSGGHGDISLALRGPDRIAYLHLWPHARPWMFAQPQPALRAVADARSVAATLTHALSGAPGVATARPQTEDGRATVDTAPVLVAHGHAGG